MSKSAAIKKKKKTAQAPLSHWLSACAALVSDSRLSVRVARASVFFQPRVADHVYIARAFGYTTRRSLRARDLDSCTYIHVYAQVSANSRIVGSGSEEASIISLKVQFFHTRTK